VADSKLVELAARYGIDPGYHDVWGAWHDVAEDSLRALLSAMGIPASNPREVEESLQRHERACWQTPLPGAVVVRRAALDEGIHVRLNSALDGSALAWRVREENGTNHNGTFDPRELRELARAQVDAQCYRTVVLPLSPEITHGYHTLGIFDGATSIASTLLIVVPERCFEPHVHAARTRLWGGALQLYGLQSERNWGIGDFTDLRTCVEQWGERGAALLGVNPMHAMFLHNPEQASPYSPSSRLFRNALYLDVEAIADFRLATRARDFVRSADFAAKLRQLRAAELVNYAGVAAAKLPVLELLYAHFREHELAADTARARAFRVFCADGGDALSRYALFEALQESLQRADPKRGVWQQWPDDYRDPNSPQVTRFAKEHSERIGFFQYLQWQADQQLAQVDALCAELEMPIGLYADLAVSVDRAGSEAWANQQIYALNASVGAPPDDFNVAGQDWGLPPWVPARLQAAGYAPLIATLRANMARAGALRIDHVMGLARLFWVPSGTSPVHGAYVRYPFQDMLGIVALESHRNRCLVVGEDLGTVPDEVRHGLQEAGILSYRLLIFERDFDGRFKVPADYPAQALAAVTTHDLPTLAGYWQGHDLEMREALGLFANAEQRDAQLIARARDRAALLLALERERLLPAGANVNPISIPTMTPEFALALHTYLARSPAAIVIVQFEDVLGMLEQANLPGTIGQYPNWRRKLPLALELWDEDARLLDLASTLAALRGAPARAPSLRRPSQTRIPRASYRLQFHAGFTFRDAAALVPYLAALGISHVYCSPYLRARSGSTHGYDIIDHQSLNPEIGSREDFDRFVDALRAYGMSQILDIVPNHMGVLGADNAWWLEVLENGPASVYADFFDVDWQPASADLTNRVLVPALGNHYGTVLARGELKLACDVASGAFSIRYNAHRFPVDPREYPRILERALERLAAAPVPDDALAELKSLVSAFGYLPARDERDPARIAERSSNKEVHKRRLAQLAGAHAVIAEAIHGAVRAFNGSAGDAASFDALHALLEAQAYRLAYWRVASDEINYRRFFDINDLAALRIENEAVFEATHRFVFDLVSAGAVQALRVDHPDGLFDPAAYFRRLQDSYRKCRGARETTGADASKPLYVVIEKIIAPFENMPTTWPVHGTTGYRYANVVNGLFVDTAAEAKLTRIYQTFIGDETPFEEIARRCKRLILGTALASELTVLANQLARIARADRSTRDYTLNTLRLALAEVISAFPVYRTYIADKVAPEDRRYIEWAVGRAKRHSRAADATIFDFVKATLLCEAASPDNVVLAAAVRVFARKFQQVTAPVMAKGVEDTAFYIYNRLLSLNDVGGDPTAFGCSVSAFHGASADRAANWPHTMLATSTHDNKRSEDVRARIDVLSEVPEQWRLHLRRWSRMNRSKKRTVDGERAPTANDEYMIYQTLIGSFQSNGCEADALIGYRERIESYVLKAVREAKVNTSWMNHNDEYEAAVTHFVRDLLAGPGQNIFLDDFRNALVPIAWIGMLNSLSMTLIKLTSPGVPDCYQGNEIWDFSLVDPDNRRAVDYELRRRLLSELDSLREHEFESHARSVFGDLSDGRAKLYIIRRLLALRRERPEIFLHGGYTPVHAHGARAECVVTYARRAGGAGVVVVAGRLFATLGIQANELPCGAAVWADTRVDLPFLANGCRLRHVLTGATYRLESGGVQLADVCADTPGAVLVYDDGEADAKT